LLNTTVFDPWEAIAFMKYMIGSTLSTSRLIRTVLAVINITFSTNQTIEIEVFIAIITDPE